MQWTICAKNGGALAVESLARKVALVVGNLERESHLEIVRPFRRSLSNFTRPCRTVFREKESLVAVRSMNDGLVMHFMYFPNEVRDFG